MSDHALEQPIGRVAADIMFGDKYMDLLETIYSQRPTIGEFETNPKQFLTSHGIGIPDAIEVIIHDPGSIGRPARVDFHWKESEQAAPSGRQAARQRLRELARLAWDTLHSRDMMQLKQTVQASPNASKEFASNPKAYLAAHHITVPEGIDVIVHLDDPRGLRIDCHFGTLGGRSRLKSADGGCCYCSGHECCYYAD